MNILNIFSDKKDGSTSNDQTTTIENGLYTIGWRIQLKSAVVLSKVFSRVTEDERAGVYDRILEEIKTMEIKLKDAIVREETFVNLFGNVVRVDDIEMITIQSSNSV